MAPFDRPYTISVGPAS